MQTRDPRIVQSFKSKCRIAYFKITVLPVQIVRGYFELLSSPTSFILFMIK